MPTAVFTLGGCVRQDQYNYYPSADPFADFTPDLQSATVGQNRRLTNAGARTSLSYVKGIHNIKIGATIRAHISHGKGHFRPGRSDGERPLSECRRKRRHEPIADQPGCLHGWLQPNVGQGSVPAFIPILACYDLTRTAAAARFRRLPESDQQRLRLLMATPISRNLRFTPGRDHRPQLDLQPRLALR